ncbi:MAG: hypothetical protein JW778_01200 [Candidatus Altiarchaeota archaeon]|nr:hypothetical protein [Candidatus Altiarchaeota archaeon]
MNLLADIRLRWYDDESLLSDDSRKLIELLLDSLGVSRDIASDLFEVLLLAKSKGVGLTSSEIRKGILELREKRGVIGDNKLSLRNIQIWLKFFRDLELVERIGSRYLFSKNKKPSVLFMEKTKPEVIDKSVDFIHRLLEEIEKSHNIR